MMWFIWIVTALILIKAFNKMTTGKCYCESVMTGKVVIVTGASGGIGFETALDLARRGAKVIIACHDDERGKRTVETIIKQANNQFVKYIHLDLSSLKSVRKFVKDFASTEAKLDVLINNAGVIYPRREKTEDGIIKGMQINHFGPFLLTVLLVPLLKKSAPSRVVIVSSAMHNFGNIQNINDEKKGYLQTYANSKLCNVLFSNELARRLEGTGVTVNSLNPGQVNTSLYRSSSLLNKLKRLVLSIFFKSPAEGAQTSLYLAVSHECDYMTGCYLEDCSESRMSPKAKDKELAAKLWSISEELVKLTPEETL
ncbi:unnamed protein product [Parnassius apollo]|uniref:(apollo) hypothetical protein n=1 Tax=Parnassius apollo TaxID=110799 RepID=A0A8S3XXR3_PARAO|nr:unnamed protein product [Parnassius apollo]